MSSLNGARLIWKSQRSNERWVLKKIRAGGAAGWSPKIGLTGTAIYNAIARLTTSGKIRWSTPKRAYKEVT